MNTTLSSNCSVCDKTLSLESSVVCSECDDRVCEDCSQKCDKGCQSKHPKETNTKEIKNKKHLLLVDGHAVAFYSWFASGQRNVTRLFFHMIVEALYRNKCSHLIVTFDPEPPTFRHDIYPAYKANRPPHPEEFFSQVKDLEQILKSFGIPQYKIKWFEADDVLGTLSSVFSEENWEKTIFTCDTDLLQIVSRSTFVDIFSQYRSNRLFDLNATKEKYEGINPELLADLKALTGDRSDNFPGLPGIGEKTAIKLIKNLGSLENIYKNLNKISDIFPRASKKIHYILQTNQELAFTMRQLSTIVKTVPISNTEIDLKFVDQGLVAKMNKVRFQIS